MTHFNQNKNHILLLSCALFFVTWLMYANTLSNRFAFDDKSLIVENRLVNESFTLKEIFSTNYRYGAGFTGDGLYRPLVILSFVLNKTDSGKSLNPVSFHVFNITLNALNSILLFLLVLYFTSNVTAAFICALIFSLHPIHTEAVANIAGRPELMCAFFMLLSWLSYGYSERKTVMLVPSVLFLLGALVSKETAVMLPFMIFAVDAVEKKPLKSRSMALKYGSMACAVILYLLVRSSVLSSVSLGFVPDFVDNPIAAAPPLERISTALGVFLRYLFLLVFPARLSADYSYNQIPLYSTPLHIVPITGGLVFMILITMPFLLKGKKHLYAIGIVLFLFPYILVSNIVIPIGTIMGERLMYIPSAGYSLILGLALVYIMKKWKKTVISGIVVVLLLFSAKILYRNRDWHDDFSLFSADSKTVPKSVKVLCNMGFLAGHNKGSYYLKALEIYPECDEALRGFGKTLYVQKKYKEASFYYAKSAKLYPGKSVTRYDYGTILDKLNRFNEAEKELLAAINLNPSYPKPYEALGGVYIKSDDFDKAIAVLNKGLELHGNKRNIFSNLALAYFLKGNPEKAHEYVTYAERSGIRLNPEMVQAIRSSLADRE